MCIALRRDRDSGPVRDARFAIPTQQRGRNITVSVHCTRYPGREQMPQQLPYSVFLLIIGSSAVARKPVYGGGKCSRISAYIIRSVRLRSFYNQLCRRHYGRYFVARYAQVRSEIGTSKTVDGDIASGHANSVLLQWLAVFLRSEKRIQCKAN